MLSPRTFKKADAYPGQYTPKKQLLKAMTEGYFELDDDQVELNICQSETKEYYKVELTVPGLKRENLVVKINDEGDLCIYGMKQQSTSVSNDLAVKTQRKMETFKSEIALPDYVDTSFVSAACHSGTLSILFTKADTAVKRRASTIVVY